MPWATYLARNPNILTDNPELSILAGLPALKDLPQLCKDARRNIRGRKASGPEVDFAHR